MSKIGTDAIHAGQPADPTTGAVIIPISLSTTFQQESPGVHKGFDYSRSGNPTRNALEQNIAALEKGKYGLAFASGLATSTCIFHLLSPGDEVVCADDVYGGTRRYFSRIASPISGIKFFYVDFNREGALAEVLNEKTKLVWIESPTNPTLKLFDISAIVKQVKEVSKDAIIAVDNTFMTPYFQQPLLLGADIAMHSATKYLNGHSDVVMGVCATNSQDLYERLKFIQNGLGAVPSPFDCFLLLRGLKTLHVRMQRHEDNAKKVADYLQNHPKVEKVFYPGLPSHPQHELAKRQTKGFGGMITFYIRGGLEESKSFLSNLKLLALAESLGGVESLIEHPAIMTHASVPPEARIILNISSSMIRISVGIEEVEDIIADLELGFSSFNPVDQEKE